ncbi:S8 family serine peptidase [Candidatus Fermentibacteria bacterium]|nr:S8 family serine peptidase [Candidatus Fermentibacteria bacterium]
MPLYLSRSGTRRIVCGAGQRSIPVSFQMCVCLTVLCLAAVPPWVGGADATQPGAAPLIYLKYAAFDPIAGEPAVPPMLQARPENTVRLVHVGRPLQNDEIATLEAAGAQVLSYVPEFTYLVNLQESDRARVAGLPLTRWIGEFHPAYKIQAGLLGSDEGDLELNVMYFREVTSNGRPDRLMEIVARCGGIVTEDDGLFPLLRIRCAPRWIQTLASLPEVRWIDRYDPPVRAMNYTRVAVGAGTAAAGGFTGSGIVGEVKDDGIDQTHQDFGNLIGTYGSPAVDSHGTCTFGIVFGDGTGSANATGMMPSGSGVFANWSTSRSASIQNLKNTWGGVFQTNSWIQGNLDGDYSSYSNQNDDAVVLHDVLMLYSAGNSNYGVGSQTVSQDAVGKNVIAVGAVCHFNTVDLSDDRWQNGGSGNTPSQGPAADSRIKPDLCAFFDYIYTTDRPGAAGYANGDYFTYFGGTSAAAPIVAGSAGLVYEMYGADHFGTGALRTTPHAATVKAILIANAHQYSLTAANRYRQGWGLPDVGRIHEVGPNQLIIDGGNPLCTGQTWSTNVTRFSGEEPLKLSLVWSDKPGEASSSRALINDLDLKVTDPNGDVYRGNCDLVSSLWSSPGGSFDRYNNVENVFIQSPIAGAYLVEVVAFNVAQDNDPAAGVNQDFSLVATMTGGSALAPMGLSIQQIDATTARLSWSAVTGATHYCLYRSQSPYFSASALAWQTVAAPTLQYDFTAGVGDPSTSYYFRGVARNATESSPESNIVGEMDYDTDIP